MPFAFNETIHGIKHRCLKWQKALLKRPEEYFLQQLSLPGPGQNLLTISGAANNCPICGYKLAVLTNASGWRIETCSATGIKPMCKSSNLVKWLLDLLSLI